MKMKKKLITAVAATAMLASCGTKTIVREVQVTQAPTTTQPAPDVDSMSTTEAILWIRENAPTLGYESDAMIYKLMGTACDTIDEWYPDYRGYLSNARDKLSGENTEMRSQISVIIVGAISSICTQHKQGIMSILNADA
jgi:hypothetical protein